MAFEIRCVGAIPNGNEVPKVEFMVNNDVLGTDFATAAEEVFIVLNEGSEFPNGELPSPLSSKMDVFGKAESVVFEAPPKMFLLGSKVKLDVLKIAAWLNIDCPVVSAALKAFVCVA